MDAVDEFLKNDCRLRSRLLAPEFKAPRFIGQLTQFYQKGKDFSVKKIFFC
ncbi:Uncharacterised protein [Mycobacteroides abscessus subsp. abscessus]|nr:Uncharacterised protein [Mycobacteroides abscessus subsp. abscessus]